MNLQVAWITRVFRFCVMLFLAVALYQVMHSVAYAQTSQAKAQETPFVVEYYYKARWGFAGEFLQLFKKNHYPILKKEMELGRILQIKAESPRYHSTEDGRWDYRVTIVWKNVQVTEDDFDVEPIIKQLYPDQKTFEREEQRRFEILLAHWDVPIATVNLDKK